MNFNSEPNKQAHEVIFSRKDNKINNHPLLFNQNLFKSSSTQRHFGVVLDTKLDFNLHLKKVQSKVNKTMGLRLLPKESLVTIYKSFIRSHLDYRDNLWSIT